MTTEADKKILALAESFRKNPDFPVAVLHSLARTVLVREQKATLPLYDLDAGSFAAKNWSELGFDARLRVMAGQELAMSFTGKVKNPGEKIKDLPDEAFAACNTPKETASLIFALSSVAGEGMTYSSSGSTGTPKRTAHSWEMLAQELFALDIWIPDFSQLFALTPVHHSYGFMLSVLIPAYRNRPFKVLPPLSPLVREKLEAETLVVAFPDFWRNMPHEGYTPPANITCISATAPWPAAGQQALSNSGYASLVEMYGSSENGVIGCRTKPDAYYELLPFFSRGASLSGSAGYALRRDFPGEGIAEVPAQDHLDWQDEAHFLPLKRLDSAVQVSGINVYPARIADKISMHPGVKDCKARLMRPEEGWRMKAFVVPADGWSEADLRPALRAYCQQHFSAPERPGSFAFGDELPKTIFGKDADWQ